jgi:hypothetical protein
LSFLSLPFPPCCHRPAPAENRDWTRDQHSVLRWEQWVPIFTRIVKNGGSKKKYEMLKFPTDLKWFI